MRKHMSTVIAILVFITGLSLLLYPTVSNYWNSLHQSRVVANYSDTMKKMDQKEKQAAIDAAVAYNETLLSNAGRFILSDSELSLYNSLLINNCQEEFKKYHSFFIFHLYPLQDGK